MISSSKKLKRGISDTDKNYCEEGTTKKQKGTCELLIASNTVVHDISIHIVEGHEDVTPVESPQKVETTETQGLPCILLPQTQYETETTIEPTDILVDPQHVLEGIATLQQAQGVDTWYEFANDAIGEDLEESEELTEFNPYLFIKNLPAHQPALRTLLPPRLSTDPKLCLVLDLDETLVHCSTEELLPADLVFPVVFNNVEYTVFARKRPYIEEFLSQMAALFEIVVFTASQEVYADRLLNILDPNKQYIRHRLFRDSCICIDGNYLKDLTILGRDLSKVVIVDNSPQAFGYQIDNGIPIESWFDDAADEELMRLVPFLESIVNEPDVRPHIREKFKLYELVSKS